MRAYQPRAVFRKLSSLTRESKEMVRKKRPIRWVCVDVVWNVKAGRYIRRKDGKPFRFPLP